MAAVAYFLYQMRGQWGGAGRAFAQANYLYVIPSVGFIAVVYALRVLRWRVFLNPIKRVPYSAITSATLIGFMSTCVLPFRPGEIIRPYVLHRKGGISFGHAAGTAVGLERVFDLIGACFLLLLTLLLLSSQEGGVTASSIERRAPVVQAEQAADSTTPAAPDVAARRPALADSIAGKAIWFAALTAVGFVCLLALAFFPSPVLRVAGFCLRVLPHSVRDKLIGFLNSIAQSMRFLTSPLRLAVATLLSLAIWSCFPLSTYSLARGFNLELSFPGALVTQVAVTAAVVPPQAPGFVGVFQAAAMEGVKLSGVPPGDAGAFAMMLWAVNVIPITIIGLGALWREGWGLSKLAKASRESAAEAEATEPRVES